MKKTTALLTILFSLILCVVVFAACSGTLEMPTYEVPSISATYGQTLGDITLPEGFSWVEDVATSVGDAGTHVFHLTYTPTDTSKYQTVTDIEVTVTVGKGTASYTAVAALSATYGQTLGDIALPAGFAWQESTSTTVGTVGDHVFHVVFTPSDTANYDPISNIPVTVSVAKATYDLTGVTFEDKTVTYNGVAQSLAVAGTLPEGVKVTYENNGKTGAGVYEVTAHFSGDANHAAIADKKATLTINKATYDMRGVTFSGGSFTYDGAAKSIVIAGELPQGVTVAYENNAKIDAGTYNVVARFTGDATNYNAIADLTATLTIAKADISGLSFAGATYTYDGTAKTIAVAGTDDTMTVRYDVPNSQTNAGDYLITATITKANYNDVTLTATLTIHKATYDMTGVIFSDKVVAYDGAEQSIVIAGTLPSGVTVVYRNNTLTNVGNVLATAVFSGDTVNYEAISNLTATMTIEKAQALIDLSAVQTIFTYDGTEQSISGAVGSGEITYKNNAFTNAGTYAVTVQCAETDNYLAGETSVDVTVNKANAFLNAYAFTREYTYDGTKKSLVVVDPTRVSGECSYFMDNDPDWDGGFVDAGSYWVGVNVAESDNYLGNYYHVTMTISNADMTDVSVSQDGVLVYDGTAQSAAVITDATSVAEQVVTFKYALEGSAEYSASIPAFKDAGQYSVYYKATAENHNEKCGEFTVTIAKRTLQITWQNATVTYDGTAHLPTASITNKANESDEVIVSLTADGVVNVGGYGWSKNYMVLSGKDSGNYKIHDAAQATLTINKAPLTVRADNKEITYGDALPEFTATITGFVNDETAAVLDGKLTLSTNYEPGASNWGNYSITPSGYTSDNYDITFTAGNLRVNKATYDMSGVTFANKTVTYDGTQKTITITGELPAGVNVNYTNNTLTNAGNTVATASFTGSPNYNAIADMNATLTITKATYDMSGVTFENKTVPYNGNVQTILITGSLPLGVEVEYTNNALTNVGDITATASFTGDADNYYLIDDMYAILTIVKGDPQIQVSDPSKVYDGSPITAPVVTRLGDGAITILYRENKNEAEYKADRPVAAGSYYVKVSVAESANWVAASVEQLFGIMGEQEVLITSSLDKAYDEKPVAAPAFTAHGDGAVTIEYKGKLEDDSAYTEEAPINAGDYIVRVTVARDSNFIYAEGSATANFTIAKAAKQAAPSFVEIDYGTSLDNVAGLPTGWSYGTNTGKISSFNFTTDYTSDPSTYAAELAAGKVGVISNRILSYTADANHEGVSENVIIPIYIMKGTRTATVKDDAVTEYLTGITPPDPFIFDYNFVPIHDSTIHNETIGNLTRLIEYKAYGADDSTYAEEAPKTPGDYVMRVTVSATKYMKAAVGTADLTFVEGSVLYAFEKDGNVYHIVGLDQSDLAGTFYTCDQTYSIDAIYANIDDGAKVLYCGYWSTKDVCDMVAYEIREESGTILMELDGDALVPFDFGDPYAIYYAYVERDGEENVTYVGETMLITQKGGEWYLFGLYDQTTKRSIYGFTTRGQFDYACNSETFSYDTVNNRIYLYEIGLGGEPELYWAYSYDTATNECSEYYGEIQFVYYWGAEDRTLAFCTINGEVNVTVYYDGEHTEQELSSFDPFDYWYGSWYIENSELHYDGHTLIFDVDGTTLTLHDLGEEL